MLGGEALNFQAVANITYGYQAARIGIPRWMAEAGAGAYQRIKNEAGSASTWFDDPFDNYMIRSRL